MKVWITKYALTQGITEHEAERTKCDPNVVLLCNAPFATYYGNPDWHTTRMAAVERANEMRKSKLASLKKQVAKLKKLRFEEP